MQGDAPLEGGGQQQVSHGRQQKVWFPGLVAGDPQDPETDVIIHPEAAQGNSADVREAEFRAKLLEKVDPVPVRKSNVGD